MKLIIRCSWCSRTMGEKYCEYLDENLPRITHSICRACSAKVLEDLERSNNKKLKMTNPNQPRGDKHE